MRNDRTPFGYDSFVAVVFAMFVVVTPARTAEEATSGGHAPGERLDYAIKVEAAHKEVNDKYFWFHPYLAAIPDGGRDGMPAVILVTQKHLVADDHYSNTFVMRTNDLGKTWSSPTPVPQLKWLSEGGYDLAISSIVPNWHPQSGKLIAIGHSNLHNRPSGFIARPGATWPFYTVYDPQADQWSDWEPLGNRAKDFYGAAAGCGQWIVEPDGSLLVPIYVQQKAGAPWGVLVLKCTFDGRRLHVQERGNLLERPQSRGIHEPSLIRFKGQYYLTIRSDDTAFVSTSADGLHFEPMREWRFDDGKVLGSHNTQQHWVSHVDGLFLLYARAGANNDHVFRHRAPLFIAQVDPERLVVLRMSERIVFPERGVPLGNFGANHITADESWVSVGENMWNYGKYAPTAKGAEGAILIGRIRWSKPNLPAPGIDQGRQSECPDADWIKKRPKTND